MGQGREIIENEHSTDMNATNPASVCVIIDPDAELCCHVQSRFECLFSMTLTPGEWVRVGGADVCARRCGRSPGCVAVGA